MKKGLVLAALVSLAVCGAASASHEISVTGEGAVTCAADTMTFSAEVISRAKTKEAAVSENAARMKKLRTAMIASGAEANRISTGDFSVSPEYESDGKGKRKLIGYLAENRLDVTVVSLDKASAVIDAATRGGADRVDSISFATEHRTPYEARAYREAAEDSRTKALAAAETLGRPLGQVLSASADVQRSARRYGVMLMARAANTEEAATPIEAGEQRVTANVSVTYGTPDEKTVRKISVSGSGTVTETADRAVLTVTTEGSGETAAKASAQNAEIAQKVWAAARAAGADADGISTTGYSLYPVSGKKKGFTVQNTIQIRFSDVSRAGKAADAVLEAGASRVSGVSFSYSQEKKFRAQSVSRAVDEARKRAETVAAALGCGVGEMLSLRITETNCADSGARNLYLDAAAKGGTEIIPSRQDITTYVEADFALI